MVEVGTGTASSRFLKRNWPIEEGLTAGTTKQEDREKNLIAEDSSKVLDNQKRGIR